jgi:hypothetical protein
MSDDEDGDSQHEEPVLSVTLELIGFPAAANENGGAPGVTIRKIDENFGGIRILVSLPRLVDTGHASLAADLLQAEFEQLNCHFFVEKVKLVGLRFTSGGISGTTSFLGTHTSHVRKLVLNDVICGRITPSDESNFLTLCQLFQYSVLDIVDLSHNAVAPYVWKAFDRQQEIKTLFLHDIEMNDASFQSLKSIFDWGDSMSNFHVSNLTRTGEDAIEAMDDMLRSCNNMRTFTWISDPEVQLEATPATGLAQLARNMFKNNFSCCYKARATFKGLQCFRKE